MANSETQTEPIQLSIIIVCWNTRELLDECLESIYASGHVADVISLEVLVVDNASDDGSAELVHEKYPQVTLIRNTENLGFGKANNQAVQYACGKYLMFLNSDTRFLDPNVDMITRYMDDHPSIAIATGKVLNEDGTFQRPFRRFPTLSQTLFANTVRRITNIKLPSDHDMFLRDLDPDKVHEVDWVTGAYMFVRKSLVVDDRVFDDDIFMYYEDTLLCWQVRQRGYSVVYLPYAEIIHHHGVSARKARPWTVYQSFRGSVIYFKNVHGIVAANVYQGSVIFFWWLIYIGFAVASLIPNRRLNSKRKFFRELLEFRGTRP